MSSKHQSFKFLIAIRVSKKEEKLTKMKHQRTIFIRKTWNKLDSNISINIYYMEYD
ncbi:MAG: hypothetical protein MUE81_08610 [Thermoflexibacter sp.]|jgi:hypothetical protein|nr:hypothetical protein [Thermoflexibacter sp.]